MDQPGALRRRGIERGRTDREAAQPAWTDPGKQKERDDSGHDTQPHLGYAEFRRCLGDGDVDLASANHHGDGATGGFSVLLNDSSALAGEFSETICTEGDFHRLSVPSAEGKNRERTTKYTLPARDEAELLQTVVQNARIHPAHEEFLRDVFPERFGTLTGEEYEQLIGERANRDYYAGDLSRVLTPEGFLYTFTAITGAELESPDPAELAARWSGVVGVEATNDADGQPLITFPRGGRLVFVEGEGGEGVVGVEIRMENEDAFRERAEARGILGADGTATIAGTRFVPRS